MRREHKNVLDGKITLGYLIIMIISINKSNINYNKEERKEDDVMKVMDVQIASC